MNRLLILEGEGDRRDSDLNISELAKHWGISSIFAAAEKPVEDSGSFRGIGATLVHADSLGLGKDFAKIPASSISDIFVYGLGSNPAHLELVASLAGPLVDRIAPIEDGTSTSFSPNARDLLRQLVGCEFARERGPSDHAFTLKPGASVSVLVSVSGRPVFIRTSLGKRHLYLLSDIGPIPGPASRIPEKSLTRICDRFVPMLVFLRAAFGDACWENPVRTARITIDDPLLARRYGFLDYERLMSSAQHKQFGISTAFIPCNFERTTKSSAARFSEYGGRHSICVHGCDHTKAEFGTTIPAKLDYMASTALVRMNSHAARTGLPFDKVMVFPQGKFSASAARSVRRAGFLAAVCTTRIPTDSEDRRVTLGEELNPASDIFSGFPLFRRMYPRKMEDLALDLFLGKSANIVEHHEWFEQGYSEVERWAEWLNNIEPGIEWLPLGEALTRQHLRRVESDGSIHVRFFTHIFRVQNQLNEKRTFRFSKRVGNEFEVAQVTLDGSPVKFARDGEWLVFESDIAASSWVTIEVHDQVSESASVWVPGPVNSLKVSLRRRLSEFRDGYLVKYPRAYALSKKLVRLLKWSTDSMDSEKRLD